MPSTFSLLTPEHHAVRSIKFPLSSSHPTFTYATPCQQNLPPPSTTRKVNSPASILLTCGSANLTLFRYNTGPLFCTGLPSKYTSSNFFLSLSTRSISWKSSISQLLAQIFSSSVKFSNPVSEEMGLDWKSRISSLVFCARGSRDGIRLSET